MNFGLQGGCEDLEGAGGDRKYYGKNMMHKILKEYIKEKKVLLYAKIINNWLICLC